MQTSFFYSTRDGVLATAVLRELHGSESFSVRSGEKPTMNLRTGRIEKIRINFVGGRGKSSSYARVIELMRPEARFQRLAAAWHQASENLSSMTAMVLLPEYQSIIGMGDSVVPLLLRDFAQNPEDPDHWHWALNAITNENPVPPEDMGNTRKIAAAWLKWAEDRWDFSSSGIQSSSRISAT